MNLIIFLLVMVLLFGGGGFCCGGTSGSAIGLLLMFGLVGRFAMSLHER